MTPHGSTSKVQNLKFQSISLSKRLLRYCCTLTTKLPFQWSSSWSCIEVFTVLTCTTHLSPLRQPRSKQRNPTNRENVELENSISNWYWEGLVGLCVLLVHDRVKDLYLNCALVRETGNVPDLPLNLAPLQDSDSGWSEKSLVLELMPVGLVIEVELGYTLCIKLFSQPKASDIRVSSHVSYMHASWNHPPIME